MRAAPVAPVIPASLAREEFALWGGLAVVIVSDPAVLEPALAEVRRTVAAFDLACSSFRADSELSLLNASGGEPVLVGPILFRAVQEAVRASRLTDGAVDPTVGQALAALGINPPLDAGSSPLLPVPGCAAVTLDEAQQSITLGSGTRLDLGATAKALAADMAAAAANSAAGCGVLVGLCGDIAVVGDPPERGWPIRIADDHRHGDLPGQTVAVRSGGLATSSVTVRRVSGRDGTIHHLIDPVTGRSAGGPWRTVSVTATSCLDANIASTAAIVMGGRAPVWLQRLGLPARLIGHDGSVRYTAGWPREGDHL